MNVEYTTSGGNLGPPDGRDSPRFMGPATFARLPGPSEVESWDVSVVGVPFDAGTSYRPGARFGPSAIRAGSKLLRPHHPALHVEPFADQQVVDAGDIAASPYSIEDAIGQIERGADELLAAAPRLVSLGGDHTIALPLLRAINRKHGPVALVHFDAHLDTWDTYMSAPYTHGTPFRRAAEEGLFVEGHSMHVGIRGSLYGADDLEEDAALGFAVLGTWEIEVLGIAGVVSQIRERVGEHPLCLSIDIDVLDPAFAPGTGTPEIGGFSSRELAGILRGLAGLDVVGADIVEVAPAYDHAEVTAIAAANMAYEILALMAVRARGGAAAS
jgi:agmatinase